MTLFFDRATIQGQAKITPEGYFVADALVARANNVQEYRASELGLTDRGPNDVVRVFRPESAVFAADSLMTLARLPITLDHPVKDGKPVMVDAGNWREFTRGQTDDQVMRDGEFLRVPLRITDANAVQSVRDDRQEFSLGYTAEIRLEAGTFGDQAYDAVAGNFRYNHLAACRSARGGSELRIVDERPNPTPQTGVKPVTTNAIMVDGLSVNLEDAIAAGSALRKLLGERDEARTTIAARDATISEQATTLAARDAEIVTLKDQVDKAKVTPQQLRDAAASYSRTKANAEKLGATVTDAMSEPEVRKAAVVHKMGDRAKDYTDEQVAAAFDTLVHGLGDQAVQGTDALRTVISETPLTPGDGSKAFADARAARFDRYATAHRGGDKKEG